MDNNTLLSGIIWVAAGAALVLLIMRRRKRKMSAE